jgi:hypothetical protein
MNVCPNSAVEDADIFRRIFFLNFLGIRAEDVGDHVSDIADILRFYGKIYNERSTNFHSALLPAATFTFATFLSHA